MLKLALRMTMRDWRAGELRFLLAALALAVASLSAVQFFADRMGAGLRRDAHQLLGADLRVSADNALDPAWRSEAARLGLQTALTVEMPSMATVGEGDNAASQMVSLKAVGQGYPLRGSLTLREGPTRELPAPGTAWVEAGLLSALKLPLGSSIKVGERAFTVTRVITKEPDRGPSVLAFTPRVLIGEADLPATGLLQLGSFADYNLLAAGDTKSMAKFEAWMKAGLEKSARKGVSVDTLASSAKVVMDMLARAESFLSLVGLLSTLLASVAVAMAARRFTLRHADASAMLRCLGLSQNRILGMYLVEFLIVGLGGSILGVLCGFAGHFVLLEWLGKLVTSELAPASWVPAASGLGVGILLLVGFGLPPLLQLRNVSHNRLLRREANPPQPIAVAAYVAGLGMFGALLLWQSGDLTVGLLVGAAFVLGLGLFVLLAWAAVGALRYAPGAIDHGVWRLALADMRRRPAATITQVVALALGLMALLLLTVVRGDLLDAWRDTAPADAPNHLVFRIEPDQRDGVAVLLQPYGQPVLYPRIVSRIVAINGKPVNGASFDDPRAKQLIDVEHGVSTAAVLPAGEKLVAGRWLGQAAGPTELSVAEDTATMFKLKLGDKVRFEIAGTQLTGVITSLRKVDRRSRRTGFNWLLNPSAAEGLPRTYVTAMYVPPADTGLSARLSAAFPNLAIVDTGAMIAMFQRVLAQVSAAIEFLFVFTLVSGVLVLYATLVSSQDERVRQAALLRALGASRAQLSRAQWIEYALTGALAGLLASGGATAASWALARYAFKLAWHFSPLLWGAGLVAGALCALIGGWAGLRTVLNQPPLQSLRA